MNIPEELKSQRQWVCWVDDKTPIDPLTLRGADTTEATTWGSFEQAFKAIGKTATYKNKDGIMVRSEVLGVGFVLANGYAGVDLDSHNNPIPDGIVDEFTQKLDSYTEKSRSGDGFHIIGKSSKEPKAKRKKTVPFLEMYTQGRYFIMTGDVVESKPIRDFTEEFIGLNEKYLPKVKKPSAKANATNITLDDAELLSRARKAKNGAIFDKLFSGDWTGYPSQSEADQAFCNMLAFWTGRDADQMERIFRQSGLYRDKCDKHPTYLAGTIQKAIDDCQSVYGGRISAEEAFGELDWEGNLINKPDDNGQKVKTNQLPYIQANNRSLPSITDQAIKALVAKNWPPELFIRSGNIAKIINTKEKDNRGRIYNRPIIKLVNEPILRDHLGRSANYIKVVKKKGELESIPAIPPRELVQNVLVQDNLPLPLLRGITQAPIMRWDGSIFSTPGYDDATSLYYAPEGNFKLAHVPDNPSPGEVKAAVELLRDVIQDFPFDSKASQANLIAAIITTALHDLIDGHIPMLLVDKPLQGTGATLLTDVISIIATGKTATIKTAPKGDDRENEWRKTITAILSEGREIVVIDNLEDVFRSENICALLTSTTWSARILGKSEDAEFPNRTIWIATGNNIRLAGDLPRRCYKVRLDANTSKPWERDTKKFKYPNLLQHVKKNRGALLAAVYTMTRAWIYAGRPSPVLGAPTMGSFEEWQATIGGILEFSGVTEFLQNIDKIFENAEINDGIEGFIEAWHEVLGEIGVTTKELQRKITFNDTLRDALPDWLDLDERGFTRKLGRVLATKVGVHFTNGYKLEKCGERHRAIMWKAARVS